MTDPSAAAYPHAECDEHPGEVEYPDSGCAKCREESESAATASPRRPKLHGPTCCSCQFCTMLRKGWTIISPDGWVFRA